MTLGSGMTSPGRKAAYPWGISDGAKDVPVGERSTKLEYDHLKPNNVLVLKLAELVKRNLTEAQIKKELDNFFEDYVVNARSFSAEEMRIIKDQLDGSWVMDKYNLSKREREEFLEKLK